MLVDVFNVHQFLVFRKLPSTWRFSSMLLSTYVKLFVRVPVCSRR